MSRTIRHSPPHACQDVQPFRNVGQHSIRAKQPQPANPSIVTIITVLAFLAEPQIALLEMARVLKLGSQSPRISRNAMTFAGLIIWETVSPRPNSRPDARARV